MKLVHLATVAAMLVSSLPASAQQDSWKMKSSAPEYLGFGAGASAGGRFYIMAGADQYWGGDNVDLHEYDPATDSWTARSAGPSSFYPAAAGFGGKILLIGGYDPYTGAEKNSLDEYDPASDRWSARAPMPSARYWHSAAATASHVFVVGGIASGVRTATVLRYEPHTNSWAAAASMPLAPERPFAGAVLGRVYVASGWTDYGPSVQTHEYDPQTNAWTRKRDMPGGGAAWGGSATLGGRLWCVGGDSWYSNMYNNLAYHPFTDTWTSQAGLPVPHYYGMAAACGGKIYATGSVYWDYANRLMEYTPPSFGSAPSVPTNLRQLDFAGNPVAPGGWASGSSIRFEADVTDPDAGDYLFLEVEVAVQGQPFLGAANAQGAVVPAGTASATYSGLAGRDYMWRARAVDVNENASAWVDFGAAGDADFRHDQAPPGASTPLAPAASNGVTVPNQGGGAVHFEWSAATDNAGVSHYEVEVSMEDQFFNTLQRAVSTTTATDLTLGTSRFAYFWRVRAVDVSGLTGPWSAVERFFVQWDDPVDHGGGDAVKVCGFSAGGAGSVLPLAAGLLVLAGLGRWIRRVPAATLVLAAGALPCAAQDSWTQKTDCPYLVSEAGAATVSGRVYVFGGYSYSFYSGMYPYTYEYDPATNAWTYRTNMPVGLGDLAVAVDGGTIYSLGGYTDGTYYPGYYVYGTVPWCFAFDVAGNSWRRIADLPTARGYAAGGAVGGKAVCAGGFDYWTQLSLAAVEEYDPGTDTWSATTALPEAVMVPFTGIAGGRMIVAGGWLNDGNASPRAYSYDPTSRAWSRLADMPAGNFGGASATVDGRLYCFGSWADAALMRSTVEYGPASNRWTRRADMPAGLAMGVASGAGGKAYTFGHTADYSLARRTQEYAPPDFGLAPGAPAAPAQNVPGGPALPAGAWMGGDTIEFSGDISDGDASQVALEVEVRPYADPFQGVANVTGPIGPAGRRTAAWTGVTPGHYKWQARALDDRDNVSAWAAGSDFHNEQTAPEAPVPTSPSAGQAVDTAGGSAVSFTWEAPSDASGIGSYDLQVSEDPGFGSTLAAGATAGTELALSIAPSWRFYYWRVRAIDGLGNVGAWSEGVRFTVALREGFELDEKKGCLGSATAAGGAPWALILAAAVSMTAAIRRSAR